jgi:hypothetical protein
MIVRTCYGFLGADIGVLRRSQLFRPMFRLYILLGMLASIRGPKFGTYSDGVF